MTSPPTPLPITPQPQPGLIEAARAFLDDWFEGRTLNGAALNHALYEVDRQELVVVPRKLVEEAADTLAKLLYLADLVTVRMVVNDDTACRALGINPYCINEGANGDDKIRFDDRALFARLRQACAGEGGE